MVLGLKGQRLWLGLEFELSEFSVHVWIEYGQVSSQFSLPHVVD